MAAVGDGNDLGPWLVRKGAPTEQIGESSTASDIIFTEQLDDQDADAPVVRFVNLLITQAINDRASDIHIEPGGHGSGCGSASSIDIAERHVPQDGRIPQRLGVAAIPDNVRLLPHIVAPLR